MRTLTIATACLLLATLSSAECVTLPGRKPGLPMFQSSSRRIQVTAVQDGRALGNVRFLFYLESDDVNPKLALTTDKQGVVLAPNLAPGHYRILAIGPENESTEAYLDVTGKGGKRMNSFLLAIPPTFLPQRASDIDRAPLTENVREFKGHVEDAGGAAIAGALVQVYRKDSPSEPVVKIKADNAGSFTASLAPGKHVVFVSSLAFEKKAVGFEIGPAGEAKDLRVELRVGSC